MSSTLVKWRTSKTLQVGSHTIFCDEGIGLIDSSSAGLNQVAGVRRSSEGQARLKMLLYPFMELVTGALVDGFIERWASKQIQKFADPSKVVF
jgi:hypothetical protein